MEYKTGKFACTHKGCERSFPTEQGLAVHLRKAHGKVGKFSATRRGGGDPEKRVVRRRKSNKFTPDSVHFCPRCGANIHNVAAALRFGG